MMKEPGLDDRHRDRTVKSAESTETRWLSTLRKIYGHGFAIRFADTDKLADVLQKAPAHFSLTQLRKDHAAGMLNVKIHMHS
jgi:hypothetical protein